MSELIGRKLGQYEITGLLGEGGMATVYRAHQTSIGRDVAIKIIESRLVRSPEFIRRFEREAKTIAALDHPHILKIYDFGREDNLLYLVMELKSGGSLTEKIRTGQLSAEHSAHYLEQIASALDHAHTKGIVHRDLKPQNVLLDEGGNAFLTDFGIAKPLSGESTALTAGGMAMGTPGYMAPEQWYGQQIDARTDLYALAVMTFEMLTGQIPFSGNAPPDLMFKHLNEVPPSLRSLRPDLPESLEKVLSKAMAKQKDQRYQTAEAFAAAFHEGLKGKTPTGIDLEPAAKPITPLDSLSLSASYATAPQPAASGLNRLPLMGISAGLIILLGIVVILLSGRGDGEATPTTAASATAPLIAANPSETVSLADSPTPLDPKLVASMTIGAVMAGWTDTPTTTFTPSNTTTDIPNYQGTVDAENTRFWQEASAAAAMMIASYTKTPTPSDTPTYTLTPTNTHTTTPTPTFTPPFTDTPTPMPTPLLLVAGVKPNWISITQDFNGVPMVLVPAGCFVMGSTETQIDYAFELAKKSYPSNAKREWFDDEKPAHEVCFDQPFWIDQTEVTQVQFKQFGGKSAIASSFIGDNFPRESITWLEARNFCTQRGARLPTEAEWEYAARGPESLIYPWGNDFDGNRANYCDSNCEYDWKDKAISDGYQYTAPAGNYLNGASWVGALDMSGNVWEWVSSLYQPYPYKADDGRESTLDTNSSRVLRGGGWGGSGDLVRAAYRLKNAPVGWSGGYGFRCARAYN